jgi:DNA (cytosine-5)-methyltransferase 1
MPFPELSEKKTSVTYKINSSRDISGIMAKVHSRDTAVELLLRKGLREKGMRYRLCQAKLPGKPDIVLPAKRIAIFIDGDYWHGGQWYRRNLSSLEEQFMVSDNKKQEYWTKKIRKNMDRDADSTEALISDGWQVIRFWESDIERNLDGCIKIIIEAANDNIHPAPATLLAQRSFAEFFAGIGLVRMGLEKQGWNVTYANDMDADKYEMYKAHFGENKVHFHLGDIHKISAESLPEVTLATASFPCNDLSLAGARSGLEGKQSSAFWGFIRILDEMGGRKPPLVLLENVTGFLTSHGGGDFRDALEALNGLGYFTDTFILDAANFVPQSRKRLFVIGMLEEGNRYCKVEENWFLHDSDTRPKSLIDFIIEHPYLKWSIRRLPRQPNRNIDIKDILEDLPVAAPEWWSADRAEYLINQMSTKHRETANYMIASRKWSYGTVFRRVRNGKSMAELRTDGIAGCLRTPRGGSGRQILFKAGYGKYFARLLTPAECARLMGADDYNITTPLNQALFGFGDAVCVPAIEWIAKYYLNPVINELIRERPLYMSKP